MLRRFSCRPSRSFVLVACSALCLISCGPPEQVEHPSWKKHVQINVDNGHDKQLSVRLNGHEVAQLAPFGTWQCYLEPGTYELAAYDGETLFDEVEIDAHNREAMQKNRMPRYLFNPKGAASYRTIEYRYEVFTGSIRPKGDPIRGKRLVMEWCDRHPGQVPPNTSEPGRKMYHLMRVLSSEPSVAEARAAVAPDTRTAYWREARLAALELLDRELDDDARTDMLLLALESWCTPWYDEFFPAVTDRLLDWVTPEHLPRLRKALAHSEEGGFQPGRTEQIRRLIHKLGLE